MRRVLRLLAVLAALVLVGTGAAAGLQPNDPAWQAQWGERLIRLPEVWAVTTGDPSIVIAIVDTGVNPIPELDGALVPGWDFIENDAVPQDTQGHGTRVATVIVARGNNGRDMAGHCWGCRLMPVRVSANGTAVPERIADGIVWAVDHGARIVSISLTRVGSPDPEEEQAVEYAIAHGVLVLGSAGNAGNTLEQYPAAYPGVLSVGATDDRDALYFWSTRGPWVTLTAPGCQVVMDASIPPGTICGTSFTPAVVAGVAGLILSRNPSLTASQVADALVASAVPVAGVSAGRVDAYAAFQRLGLASSTAASPPQAPKALAPGQLYAREARLEAGTFRGGTRIPLRVGKGRLEMQLVTPFARKCTLWLDTGSEIHLASPAVKNLLSLSLVLPAGRYTVAIACEGAASRSFTLGIIGMFPVAQHR